MSKICNQCQLKHTNGAVKCVNCGSELVFIKSSVIIKRTLIISSVVAAVVAITVMLALYFTSPEAAVRKMMEAYKRSDVPAVADCYPEFLQEATGMSRGEYDWSMMRSVENLSKYIFSYNVEKAKTPSTNEQSRIKGELLNYSEYGYDESKLEAIRMVWIGMRGGRRGYWSDTNHRFIVIKYDGKWCVWPAISDDQTS